MKATARPWVLLGLCAALFLPALATLPMTDYKELRVVLPAREMAAGGDWLMPRFQGELRLRKPPLMYWIVASAFGLARSTDSATVARLPSALMGTAAILALYAGGAGLIGRRRALLGACVAATSFLVLRHARVAQADMALCLFTLLAVLCGYGALSSGGGGIRRWLGFGVCAGLGFMTKGPAALALPVAALAAFAAVDRGGRRRLFGLGALLSLLVFAAIVVPWYLLVLHPTAAQSAAQTAIHNELRETFEGTDHAQPFFFYLHQLPAGMLPWGLLLPFAVASVWRARHHRGARFLLCWFATSFVILSLVRNKQLHYALLLVPPAALITGDLLAHGWLAARSWRRALCRGYLAGLLALVLLAGVACLLAPFLGRGWPVRVRLVF